MVPMNTVRVGFVSVGVGLAAANLAMARQAGDFVPVGVQYQLDPDAVKRRQDLEELQRLRFNVVAPARSNDGTPMELAIIERLLGGAADSHIRVNGVAVLSDKDHASAAALRLAAWYALAMGARGIVFGDWRTLQQNTDALTAAVEFADHLARNASLYAPLEPRVPKEGAADVTVAGDDPRISARFLESADALILIVTNHAGEARQARLTFSPEMPEAIWQNMLTGAAVNFVAGPEGPVYTRTFPPKDVLVLMIRKRLK